ncbi:FUSC family protein [Shewanella olleyana]|uniref:FUSC family protein n=1 Tax=Shewanella olleyana TaxID=135626 RepID=UPI00200CD1C1|nr:FUSC family protein [Shewanella olleyana]MCL1065760.1 FUSC family protein [Shewanella olleyana]
MFIHALSDATKDAIKVAFACSIAIVLALAFGWDRPYWSAVTVVTLAANESYSHSIKIARNRVLGTLLGSFVAIIMIALFSQEPGLFIAVYLLLAGICAFLSYNVRYGYIFKIGFVVCALICAVGSFSDVVSFNTIILRVQETLLGVIVFSIVFRFIWPKNSEKSFLQGLDLVNENLSQSCTEITQFLKSDHGLAQEKSQAVEKKLNDTLKVIEAVQPILNLPLSGNYLLYQHKSHWKKHVTIYYESLLTLLDVLSKETNTNIGNIEQHEIRLRHLEQLQTVSQALELIAEERLLLSNQGKEMQSVTALKVNTSWKQLSAEIAPLMPFKARLKDALIVMMVIATCFAMWIFIPLPIGILFPLISTVLSFTIVSMPKQMVNDALIGVLIFGAIVLTEYVLIMPTLTEVWQLALFYFINLFLIWRVCSTPKLGIQKVLGGNILMVMTMNAMHLTPIYDVTLSLNLLVIVFLSMAIIRFYVALLKDG